MNTLAGRVVAITGASAGIGAACADALAARGAALVLNARRADKLEEVAAAARARGARVEVTIGDVSERAALDALVRRAESAFGRLDAIVCNAGIGFHGAIDDTSREIAQRLIDVNFMGTFHAIQAAMPLFRAQQSGHIVIMSSIVGRRGIGFTSVYSASKAAQVGLAEGLRAELRGTGIEVSLIIPVSTRTEFHDAMRRNFGHAVSGLGPKQDPGDVAAAVVNCLERPRAEVYPHRLSRALVVLNALAPGFTDRVVQKYGRRRNPA